MTIADFACVNSLVVGEVMKSLFGALAASSLVCACASKPENISATYVSPALYGAYQCEELMLERERITAKVTEVSRAQSDKASNDAVATGVGVILFWPALLFLASGSDREAELASLKGNYDAISQAAIQKKCLSPSQIAAEREAAAEAERQFQEQQKAIAEEAGESLY